MTDPLSPILQHWRAEPLRCWSLIVTFMGDAILPRGGTVALATILTLLDTIDVGGNVVRTALSRLVADGWAERHRAGRHSFYRLGLAREQEARAAAGLIYAARGAAWDGVLRLVIGEAPPGSAPLAHGVHVLARSPPPGLGIQLEVRAGLDAVRATAALAWPPERLADSYARFATAFGTLRADELSEEQAMAARLLLIHHYRRLILRDPAIPDALRPADWPGGGARDLCARLYRELLPHSERWLDQHGTTPDGRLPPAGPELFSRYKMS